MLPRRVWHVAAVSYGCLYSSCASVIDFEHWGRDDDAPDGAVFGFEEAFVAQGDDDQARQIDIHLGDARLPTAAKGSPVSQFRTKKKEDTGVELDSTERKKSDISKSSKKEKAKIPDDLFRTHSPSYTPVPVPTMRPSLLEDNTMYPTTLSTPTAHKVSADMPYSKSKKEYDDDDDDSASKGSSKKAKYGSAALPPTYNDVNEKYIGPDFTGSVKPSKKLSPYTDKDGKTHYVNDSYEKEERTDSVKEKSEPVQYKKTKRDEHGSKKASSDKLQKNKQEPMPPVHRASPSPVVSPSIVSTAPPSMRAPPTERPTTMPAIASNEEGPVITSRSLSSFSLSFDFAQTRIPSNAEVYDLVAVTGAFLESRLNADYPGIAVLLTLVSTNFRLLQPFEIVLDIEVENLSVPPASVEELDAAVQAVLQDEASLEALLSVLENLPDANVFTSTTAVVYTGQSVATASSRGKSIVGVSAAAGVLAVLLLVGGGYRQWGNQKSSNIGQNEKAVLSGSQTITGETCGATTVGTRSKQTRFAFDEAMSFTSRSDWMSHRGESERLVAADEEVVFYNISPLFSDANDEEENRRVDLLANPPSRMEEPSRPAPGSVDDDLTVDSYVPLRVVDLIKHFTPGGRR